MESLILPSEKNLGPTIVTSTWYTKEVQRLLQDVKFPFDNIKSNLQSILDHYGSDKLKSYTLQHVDTTFPDHFKIIPKVHKHPLVGRPTVASFNPVYNHSPVSFYRLYTGRDLTSYLKDSTELILTLEELHLNPNRFSVTANTSYSQHTCTLSCCLYNNYYLFQTSSL